GGLDAGRPADVGRYAGGDALPVARLRAVWPLPRSPQDGGGVMTFVVERCVPNVNAAHLAVLHPALLFVYDRLTAPGEPGRWRPDHPSTRRPSSIRKIRSA